MDLNTYMTERKINDERFAQAVLAEVVPVEISKIAWYTTSEYNDVGYDEVLNVDFYLGDGKERTMTYAEWGYDDSNINDVLAEKLEKFFKSMQKIHKLQYEGKWER